MMINIIDLNILLLVLSLQIANLIKFKDTNGALRKRILMMLSVVFLIIHVARLLFDVNTGLFLLLHVATWLFIYDAVTLDWLKKIFKRK